METANKKSRVSFPKHAESIHENTQILLICYSEFSIQKTIFEEHPTGKQIAGFKFNSRVL